MTSSMIKIQHQKKKKKKKKDFRKSHRKTPALESLFNKRSGHKADCFIKKDTKIGPFPVNFSKPQRTPFFTEQPQWLPIQDQWIIKNKSKRVVKIAHVIFINRLNVGFNKNDTKLSHERKKLI